MFNESNFWHLKWIRGGIAVKAILAMLSVLTVLIVFIDRTVRDNAKEAQPVWLEVETEMPGGTIYCIPILDWNRADLTEEAWEELPEADREPFKRMGVTPSCRIIGQAGRTRYVLAVFYEDNWYFAEVFGLRESTQSVSFD